MSDHTGEHYTAQDAFQRGMLFVQRGRLRDAVPFFKQAISYDPKHAMAYAQLAMCWKNEEDTKKAALDAIGQAIALEPEAPLFRSYKALILVDTARSGDKAPLKAALVEAEEAVRLSADTGFFHAAVGYCHLRLSDWPKAEACARRALELDPEQALATQVLAEAFFEQNKHEENAALIAYQLQRNPENPDAHFFAGYADLMQGKHQSANEHFREALRLDPESDEARHGLVESFRARNILYRSHLRLSFWIKKLGVKKVAAILIGGLIAINILIKIFWATSYKKPIVLSGVAPGLIIYGYLARCVGGFLMILDRYARLSLRPKEFWESALAGGLALASPLLLIGGLYHQGFFLIAAGALLTATSLSLAFTTTHYWGKKLYWGMAILVSLCFLSSLLTFIPGFQFQAKLAFAISFLLVLISVYLVIGNIGR